MSKAKKSLNNTVKNVSPQTPTGEEHRHLKLVLLVAAVFVLIFIGWLNILPSALKIQRQTNSSNALANGWKDVNDTFLEAQKNMNQLLQNMADKNQETRARYAKSLELLKQKIEARAATTSTAQ